MDQQHRRSVARMPDVEVHLADVDPLVHETVEHGPGLPLPCTGAPSAIGT
jgi:hypothetical protein